MGTRKIVQIFVENMVVYALCDDGTVWFKKPYSIEWEKVADQQDIPTK